MAKSQGEPVDPPGKPVLNITLEEDSVIVSWPETRETYELESSETLNGVFSPAAASPLDGRPNTFRIPSPGSTLFIRLKGN